MPDLPLWAVALVCAAFAPFMVHRVADALERRHRARTQKAMAEAGIRDTPRRGDASHAATSTERDAEVAGSAGPASDEGPSGNRTSARASTARAARGSAR